MEKQSLAQQTARRLYNQIAVERRLLPGEKLPNEVDLSQELGVSRATLREALRTLIAQGLLEVRRGRGTFVAETAGQVNDFGFSTLDQVRGQLRDLFELRAIFEPAAARLACRRATEEELADILERAVQVEELILYGEDRTEADRAFHAAIVRATHNEFMVRLLPLIAQAVETAITAGEHGEALAKMTLADHKLLTDFLRRRDEEGAEHAMAIHMHHSMDVMGLREG